MAVGTETSRRHETNVTAQCGLPIGPPASPLDESEFARCSAAKGADKIGVKMSDEHQLWPEQSTSALVVHHPNAKYFTI